MKTEDRRIYLQLTVGRFFVFAHRAHDSSVWTNRTTVISKNGVEVWIGGVV